MASTKAPWAIPAEIVEALEEEGLPIPPAERVTALGYSTVENRAIEKHRRKRRPAEGGE